MTTSATTTTELHLDELRSYAVRDPEKLQAGQRVILAHVPPLERPDLASSTAHPYGQELTILEVAEKSFAELHPNLRPIADDEPKLIIRHRSDTHESYTHASDAGVIPYTWGAFYNDTNFLVLVGELEAAGITAILEVSPDYAEKLEVYNGSVDTSLEDYFSSAFDE